MRQQQQEEFSLEFQSALGNQQTSSNNNNNNDCFIETANCQQRTKQHHAFRGLDTNRKSSFNDNNRLFSGSAMIFDENDDDDDDKFNHNINSRYDEISKTIRAAGGVDCFMLGGINNLNHATSVQSLNMLPDSFSIETDSPRSLDHYYGFGQNYRQQFGGQHRRTSARAPEEQEQQEEEELLIKSSGSSSISCNQQRQQQQLYLNDQQYNNQYNGRNSNYVLQQQTLYDNNDNNQRIIGEPYCANTGQAAIMDNVLLPQVIVPIQDNNESIKPPMPPPARQSSKQSSTTTTTTAALMERGAFSNVEDNPTAMLNYKPVRHSRRHNQQQRYTTRAQKSNKMPITTTTTTTTTLNEQVEEEYEQEEEAESEIELTGSNGPGAIQSAVGRRAPRADIIDREASNVMTDQQSSATELDKWSDSEADAIVRGAKETAQMALSMYQFTKGEGDLNTTQDLFTQAELFAEEANELYKEVRCFSYKVSCLYQNY